MVVVWLWCGCGCGCGCGVVVVLFFVSFEFSKRSDSPENSKISESSAIKDFIALIEFFIISLKLYKPQPPQLRVT